MTDLRTDLESLRATARERLATATTADGVEALRHELLGRSGTLTALLRQLGSVPAEERPALGQIANQVRSEVESAIGQRLVDLREADLDSRLADEGLDMTAPGRPMPVGHLHPVHTTIRDIRELFHAYGFEIFEGPEIETEEYNFELLNIPPDHPARDLWDTLYVAEPGSVEAGQPRPAADETILRTHTSPVQVRAMRALEPPIRVLMPGRCFRYEAVDASHGFEFFQVEGLVVDRDTSMADLKGLLEEVARALYGRDVRTRFRPGYYPFTEPSVAFDIGCLVCGGVGCPACKRSGWMTILGAGMVHPVVLRAGGYDPDEYQGYAFGMGTDRMTMLRHGIGDIRLFFSGDLRFVTQFAEGR
ncbi:MAG TPA: phenylalanine--tRNA ligase subunit alpha [Candidatus Limnocylindria bacterium]|jgi:phenylalanyl-tRNA synthetase alpha chain|nr:phenylalanine--tRNA ligase subunit alpha [Candidatus Limnocylindria bacterium]